MTPRYRIKNNVSFPIDIVYTWGGDKETYDIRSHYNNELEYSIKSVFKYMSWFNHIYIITNII